MHEVTYCVYPGAHPSDHFALGFGIFMSVFLNGFFEGFPFTDVRLVALSDMALALVKVRNGEISPEEFYSIMKIYESASDYFNFDDYFQVVVSNGLPEPPIGRRCD